MQQGLRDPVSYLKERKRWIDQSLPSYLPRPKHRPSLLHRAIHYSLFAGGKRIRPILAMAAYDAVTRNGSSGKASVRKIFPMVSAIELVHTYSLVHDDLPAIDNDDWRRGRLTNHKVFGEPVAILVGDSLLTAAFTVLADPRWCSDFSSKTLLKVVHELGQASGSLGMVGGQYVDIQIEGKRANEKTLHYIHTRKTGALIRASVRIGGILAGASGKELRSLSHYGDKMGLAFQIMDDLLDVEGDPQKVGKGTGKDRKAGKATYPGVHGLRRARADGRRLVKEAIKSISELGHRADPLRGLAWYIIQRNQ